MLVWAVGQEKITLSAMDLRGVRARRTKKAYEAGKAAAGKTQKDSPCPQDLLDAAADWRRGCARGTVGSRAQGFAIFGPSPEMNEARGEEEARHTVLSRHLYMQDGTMPVCFVVSAVSAQAAKEWLSALVAAGRFQIATPHPDVGRWGGISFRHDKDQGGNVWKSNELIVRCNLGSKDGRFGTAGGHSRLSMYLR